MPQLMPIHHPSSLLCAAVLAVLVLTSLHVRAEKADRSQKLVMEADRSGEMDGQRGTTVLSGNAVVAQGTMLLRADRIEVREQSDGYRAASAAGSKAKPATWRQRADGGNDEFLEGHAERIEFDERANTLRLAGGASLRRTRGAAVVQEVNGGVIVWDGTSELARVEGGTATTANPSGRVRVVLSPRVEGPASSPAAAASTAPTAPLAPVRSLGERK